MESILISEDLLDRTVFTGLLTGEDKLAAMNCADLFVLPSHSEGFAITVLEAMAARSAAVVITKGCEFPEVSEHGAGLVVEADEAPIAEAITMLLSDNDLRKRMGQQGHKLVTEGYTWQATVATLVNLYETSCSLGTPMTNLNQDSPVDFLVVGAAKSGTSTLFETLRMHPGIFIPQRKECRYFSCMPENFSGPRSVQPKHIIKSLDEYRVLFNTAKSGQFRGDVSPDYLYYHRNAVPKILDEINAQVPIVIVLRNPIDRAYSNYLQPCPRKMGKVEF